MSNPCSENMIAVKFNLLISFQLYLLVNSRMIIPSNTETLKNLYAPNEGDAGEPLYLTPYIKSGEIEEGKEASRVGRILPDDNFTSYSGFLTVNEEFNSNLFFWFCLSEKDHENVPILLWLNGGPGASSLMGLFQENGPYKLETNGALIRREIAWTNEFNILYFDQPVGTGFSFTQNESGYATNDEDVARDMYCALVQFFQLFPEYSQNDFYLTGESYAGKYIPSIAYEIHKKNSVITTRNKINLKGCLIGNGMLSFENLHVIPDYLYQLGFIDLKTFKKAHEIDYVNEAYIRSFNYDEAYVKLDDDFNAMYSFPLVASYGYTDTEPLSLKKVEKIFENDYIRKCVHVGDLEYNEFSLNVHDRIGSDLMRSVVPLLPELLDHYKMLFYTGQLDVNINYPSVRCIIENLHFTHAIDYYELDFILWYDEMGIQAGHYKVAGNLVDLVVLNAGHMVPSYQPKRALQMVREFINGELS